MCPMEIYMVVLQGDGTDETDDMRLSQTCQRRIFWDDF